MLMTTVFFMLAVGGHLVAGKMTCTWSDDKENKVNDPIECAADVDYCHVTVTISKKLGSPGTILAAVSVLA